MTNTDRIPRLLSANEVARALGVSYKTLWLLKEAGAIPCVRVGGSVKYEASDVQAFIKANKTATRGGEGAAR